MIAMMSYIDPPEQYSRNIYVIVKEGRKCVVCGRYPVLCVKKETIMKRNDEGILEYS
jgi:hypothetical protein